MRINKSSQPATHLAEFKSKWQITAATLEPPCTVSFVGLLSFANGDLIEHTVANALSPLWLCSWKGNNSTKVLIWGSVLVILHLRYWGNGKLT